LKRTSGAGGVFNDIAGAEKSGKTVGTLRLFQRGAKIRDKVKKRRTNRWKRLRARV